MEYCDTKYCYAVKNEKMMYADDNHSVDGARVQAKYLKHIIFKVE